jgi:hypothetical protein
MKESHGEGVATHTGPESCGAAREGGVEALTGECAGRVLSRESQPAGVGYPHQFLRDADALRICGRLHLAYRYREICQGPARSETPSTYGNTSHGNREIPCPPEAKYATGRVGKSKDVRRR